MVAGPVILETIDGIKADRISAKAPKAGPDGIEITLGGG